MWQRRKNKTECASFIEAAEAASGQRPEASTQGQLFDGLPPGMVEHARSCSACALNLDNLLTTRNTLRNYAPTVDFDAPWFPARVMAKIAAEERKRHSQEAIWNVLPRLASRVAGIAALALILAGGFLIKRPVENPVATQGAESLFDTTQTQVSHEDVLGSISERAR